MLFNSLHFLIFFPVVVAIYFLIPHKWRWMLLLIASYYFYMCWKYEYIILIIASTLIDYFAGRQMSRLKEKAKRKKYLYLSLLTNLGLLFSFKYFNFFNDSLRELFNQFNIFYNVSAFNVLLPVGISFYTFQTLSYTIDVYNGKTKAEKHLGIFAVYVSFFPQLVAGPIERSNRLLPQFFKKHDFNYDRVTSGLKLMLWGFFKKVVVADRLAVLVDSVYNDPASYTGIPMVVATVFFAFQIYCDFSGYSDIAIGSARVMGYELMENFRRPYFSKSISEFWKRWHISLSTWFRDYLYIPLGGNRVVKWRWYYNLMITFIVSGLWHGANWTFLVWGTLHGFYLVFGIISKNARDKVTSFLSINRLPNLQKFIRVSITFSLVLFAWIFFRANSLSDAWFIIANIFSDIGHYFDLRYVALKFRGMGLQSIDLIYSFLFVTILLIFDLFERKETLWSQLQIKSPWIRWSLYYIILILILFYSPYNKAQNFIYFQF